MKAILIEPKLKQVRLVEVDPTKTLQEWYRFIGCSMVECAMYINDKNDAIMVDEEGMYDIDADSMFFHYEGGHQPFVGNGLIVGTDDDGNSIDPHIGVMEVYRKTTFLTLAEVKSIS